MQNFKEVVKTLIFSGLYDTLKGGVAFGCTKGLFYFCSLIYLHFPAYRLPDLFWTCSGGFFLYPKCVEVIFVK
ncbi:hypothetical protein [Enterococcus casseliflavus]|uniref:hypothetical protein n=1 Tax=Enterococcus casseliflavus TaxID=37734 RepID=UPI003D11F1F3